jgi:hypothetical protein
LEDKQIAEYDKETHLYIKNENNVKVTINIDRIPIIEATIQKLKKQIDILKIKFNVLIVL